MSDDNSLDEYGAGFVGGALDPSLKAPASDYPYDVALGVLHGFTMDEQVGTQALKVVESENKRLREALEFYADPETYIAIGFFPDPPCGEFMDDFGETGTAEYGPRPGERARKALGYG